MRLEPGGIYAGLMSLLAYGRKGSCIVGKVGADGPCLNVW